MQRYTPSNDPPNADPSRWTGILRAPGGAPSAPRGAIAGSTSSPLSTRGPFETATQAPGEANNLLRLLQLQAPAEYERLLSRAETVTLARGAVLFEPGGPITQVYFPETSVSSVIKVLSDNRQIEVGTAGPEGMAGLPAFLGADSVPLLCLIQVGGSARCLTIEAMHELATPSSAMHAVLRRYAQYLFDQAAQSIACNWLHGINERCARWLLMTHDRVGGNQFELTHEYLATMLGARRAGVSEAADALQKAGLIRYSRGKMLIVHRAGLEGASCECYASDRADYQRLLSPGSVMLPPTDSAAQ